MKKSDILNIPNLLSLLRILMIPAFVILFFRGGNNLYWAAGVLIASGLTDMLDGVIARHFHMITPLGPVSYTHLDVYKRQVLAHQTQLLLKKGVLFIGLHHRGIT